MTQPPDLTFMEPSRLTAAIKQALNGIITERTDPDKLDEWLQVADYMDAAAHDIVTEVEKKLNGTI